MRHWAVSGLRPVLTGAQAKVIELPSPMNGRITSLLVLIAAPNAIGDTIFDVNVNGVSVYASPSDRATIVAGETVGTSVIDVEVALTDMITVDLDSAPIGGISGLYMILQLDDSPTVTQYIENVYQKSFRRAPSGGELSAAISTLTSGCNAGTALNATQTFLTSIFTDTEYTSSFGATDEEYTEDLYEAVLGRPSDPGGKFFWITQLGLGMTRAALLQAFNESIEHANQRVIGWCPQVLPLTNAIQLQGFGVNGTTPTTGQLLAFNGSQWVPTTFDFLTKVFDFKDSVRVTSTANVNISSAPSSIDGVTLTSGDRVLLKNQSTGSQNGIYVFNGSGSAMTRSTDADSSVEVTAGLAVGVEEGTANADTFWWLTTNNPITLNTTALTFSQFGASGSPTGSAGGDLTGTYPNPTLATAGAGAATYGGGGDIIESIQIDAKGRVIAVTDTPGGGGGGGASGRPTSSDAPSSESDLIAWWRADKITAIPLPDMSPIYDRWFDLGPNFIDAIPVFGTSIISPFQYEATGGPNSQACIKFTTSARFQLPGFLDSSWPFFELIMIIKANDNGETTGIGSWGSNAGAENTFYTDHHWYDNTGQASRFDCGNASSFANTWMCVSISIVPSTSLVGWTLLLNNTLQFQTTSSVLSFGRSPQIGENTGNGAGGNHFSGRIAEIIVFNSLGHRANLLSYLNSRYGLSLV